MDASRFDRLVCALTGPRSRRGFVHAFIASLGLVALGRPSAAIAKNKKKRKRPRLNEFGCVDVGKPCRGKDALCCSGICQGRRPKKGKKDQSRCVAHNTESCRTENDACEDAVSTGCGTGGVCFRTTGKASFCASIGVCGVCATDADCEAMAGPGSACIVCPINGCGTGQTTLCFAPAP